jgi:hypothetical protein
MARIFGVMGTGLLLAMVTAPAMAGPGIIHVPEPATISLLAVGIGGAYVARKFFRRK